MPRRVCDAKRKRDGQPCTGYAVRGATKCRMHLGRKASDVIAVHEATKAVVTYGLPITIDPRDALLEEVYRTAGAVAWLQERVESISPDDLVWGKTEESDLQATEFPGVNVKREAKPNIWLDLYQRERKHLVEVCRVAIAAGIEERRVRLAEQMGSQLAAVIRAVLGGLGLTAQQWDAVPSLIAVHLPALTGALVN